MSLNRREDNTMLWITLGMIGTVITFALLFYGTIAAIVLHFVRKFW
jgi:hypothetical protein